MLKFIASAAVVAVLTVTLAAPATARERTDAENQKCLAVGQTMVQMGKTQKEIVDMLRQGMTNPTPEDQQTLAQLEELATSTGSVGDALVQIYGAAPKPTQTLMDELNKTPLDQLINEAEKCVD